MANKELSKTIKISDRTDEVFNINAVHSDTADEAGKTQAALVIKESGTQVDTFDGSTEKTIDYVNATNGGTFKGPVYLDHATSIPGSFPKGNEVITYSQIENEIVKLTGAPLYIWDTSFNTNNIAKNLYPVKDSDNKIYNCTTITGTESDFYILKSAIAGNGAGSPEINYTLSNTVSPIIAHWVASSLDSGASGVIVIPSTYTGTYNSSTYTKDVKEVQAIFKNNTKITSVIFPSSITKINGQTFQGCTGLLSVTIPDNIIDLSSNAIFDGCTSLRNVTLGTGITSIGTYTFRNCTNITSIAIPKNVTTIGNGAFKGCSRLTSIVIPKSVKSIAEYAFDGCDNLETIYYEGNSTDWSLISISGYNGIFASTPRVYNHTESSQVPPGSPVDASIVGEGPFIYICKDTEMDESPVSNKVFLKLPGSDEIIEISKGAARLERSDSTATTGFYTYDTLAAIIAGINSRLEALGSKSVALPSKLTATEHVLIPDTIISDEVLVEDTVVPNVLELDEKIEEKATFNYSDPVLRAVGGISAGDYLVKSYEEDGTTPKEYYSVKEILAKMLYPYTSPVISWESLTDYTTSAYRKGTEVSVTQAKVTVTKKTNALKSIALYRKNIAGALASSSINASGGTVTLTFTDTISGDKAKADKDTYEYYIKVLDTEGKSTESSSKVFTFVHPYYYGTVKGSVEISTEIFTNNTSTNWLITSTDRVKGTYSQTYTTENNRPVYAYPAIYGKLTSIKDPNNFTQAWDCTTIKINNIDYYVYVGSVSTATGVKYTFNI